MTGNSRPRPEQLFAPAEGAMEATSVGTEVYYLEFQRSVRLSGPMAVGS